MWTTKLREWMCLCLLVHVSARICAISMTFPFLHANTLSSIHCMEIAVSSIFLQPQNYYNIFKRKFSLYQLPGDAESVTHIFYVWFLISTLPAFPGVFLRLPLSLLTRSCSLHSFVLRVSKSFFLHSLPVISFHINSLGVWIVIAPTTSILWLHIICLK